jgi:hypothetical protein
MQNAMDAFMTELEVSAQKHLKAESSKPSEDLIGEPHCTVLS